MPKSLTTLAIVFLLLSVNAAGSLSGQESIASGSASLEALELKLDELAEQRQFNGAVFLATDGKMVFEKFAGYSNINEKTKFDTNASFRLGSVSKQFTAMAIMMLKEAGKLDYDDDIRRFLPELPYEGITIRHLLQHTGGLSDYMVLFNKHWDTGKPFPQRKMAYNKDTVALFAEQKPEVLFAPGEKYQYSNTGYVLLGHIVEKASGLPVREFFHSQIFQPLQMHHSQTFAADDSFNLPHRVYGFRFVGNTEKHSDNDHHYLNGMIGDGGVYASTRDLLKWDQALYANKLVKASTLEEAFTPGKLNDGSQTDYGFGWMIEETDQGKVVSHGGGWVGFITFIRRDLESKELVIVLTNHSSRHMRKVIEAIDASQE